MAEETATHTQIGWKNCDSNEVITEAERLAIERGEEDTSMRGEYIEKARQNINVLCYKLRITTDDETYNPDNRQFKTLLRVAKNIYGRLIVSQFIHSKAVMGCEVKGKNGDYVKPHFHIHFNSKVKKDTIVKNLKRYYNDEYGENLKGNGMYYLKLESYIDNEKKFYGYPLKQQEDLINVSSKGYTNEQLEELRVGANAVYKTGCEVQQARDDKREDKETLWDRLEEFLKKNPDSEPMAKIIEFYMGENRPINNTTIIGYYNLYRLKSNKITVEDYALILKNKNQ